VIVQIDTKHRLTNCSWTFFTSEWNLRQILRRIPPLVHSCHK